MSYPKKVKERAIQLADEGLSDEKIADIFNKEANAHLHNCKPDPRTIRRWLLKAKEQETSFPLTTKAKEAHIDDLLDLVKRLEDHVNKITEERPLGIIKKSMRGTEWKSTAKFKSRIETGSYGGTKKPKGICQWKRESGRITNFWLDLEEDTLFKYLQQHLERENIRSLFEEWKKYVRQGLTMGYELERDVLIHLDLASKKLNRIEVARDNLVRELSVIRLKHCMKGKCDLCRD